MYSELPFLIDIINNRKGVAFLPQNGLESIKNDKVT